MEYGKIKGVFSEEEAKLAIQQYISDGSVIRKMLNQRDRNGKKIYSNYAQAYDEVEKSLFLEYFSF